MKLIRTWDIHETSALQPTRRFYAFSFFSSLFSTLTSLSSSLTSLAFCSFLFSFEVLLYNYLLQQEGEELEIWKKRAAKLAKGQVS